MSIYDKITQSKLYSLGDKLGDLIILSLLWLVFSLPVITMGASTTALYHATTKRFYHHSGSPRQDFMRSFRRNLRQGIIINVVYLLYGAFVVFDIYVARNGINDIKLPAFYEQIAYLLLLPIIFTIPYIFAYLSRFSNTIRTTFKHSFIFCAIHPIHTILLLILVLLCGLLIFAFFPLVLLLPVTCAYICSKWIEKDFAEMTCAPKDETLDDEKQRLSDGDKNSITGSM